ncbi:hypothetical protein, conserved [Leishmania donovani]|uniref:Uncharacterized protein n=1 Tax=Leishmania donovani TaxID=5661 RepID=E9BH15_LEIDO|nr:hypothetical protein, conserved [Leishmania donovani]AYU79236.1 hypothetical protein LdCL_240020400 [Leishmania donovani]CBZ34541.1 hypothetical protein, conserved [Leishmania donovani]
MQLRCVRVVALMVASTSLPHRSAAAGLLTAPRRPAVGGLRQGRRAHECVAAFSTDTRPLRTAWRGEGRPTLTPARLVTRTDDICTIGTRGCMRDASAAVCTRSPLTALCVSCAALETRRRCCASLAGVAHAPPSPSHNSSRLRGTYRERLPSSSLPSSASRYTKTSQQRRQRAQAPSGRPPSPRREQRGSAARLRTPDDDFRDDAPPSQSEEVPTADDVDSASVADGGMGASAADDAASLSTVAHDAKAGWGLEDVNSLTGRTQLEELYKRNLDRIRAILEQPLPAMPQDGSVDPDFFVGFASYSYQLRDQYRAILARELQVPVKAVRLSVAWSGRFDVRLFGRVQKVCGVCLDRQVLLAATHSEREKNPGTELARKEGDFAAKTRITEADEASSLSSASAIPLPETLHKRMDALVAAINGRRREDLLQVSFFQASPPIPEVEFALTRREHRLLYHLHEWIRRHVLQSALVVVVYGVPPPPPSTTSTDTRATAAALHFSTGLPERREVTCDTAGATNGGAAQPDSYVQWQRLCSTRTAAQKREVQDKWLRLLHRRRVVPLMISLTALASEVAAAVVRGEVPHIDFRHAKQQTAEVKQAGRAAAQGGEEHAAASATPSASATASPVELSASLQDVLVHIAAASSSSPPFTTDDDGASAEDRCDHAAFPRRAQDVIAPPHGADTATAAAVVTPLFRPASAAQKTATMRWVRLVYQALLLRETQGITDCSGRTDGEQSTMRISHRASLPALFAQGAYAGGEEEVAYLQRNRAAMDALLLHPHEISFKKKFLSRMRNGHRRLRMEGESAAPYAVNG